MLNLFLLSFAGSSFFAFTIGVLHLVRRDLDANSSALSKYALGRCGFLLTAGIYSIGLAEIILSVGLLNFRVFGLGNALLTFAGVGALIVATFKLELSKHSFRGYLHDFGAGVQFLSFPFALLYLKELFLYHPLYLFTEIVAICNLLLFILITYLLYFQKTKRQEKYFGVIQKTNILLMNLWVMVVSFLLI